MNLVTSYFLYILYEYFATVFYPIYIRTNIVLGKQKYFFGYIPDKTTCLNRQNQITLKLNNSLT